MRHTNRFFHAALLLVVSAAVSGCALLRRGATTPEDRVPLEINNSSFFEVTVYALPSAGGVRIRIGSASSFSATVMSVPRNALRAGGWLVLQLHAVGSNRSWTTPQLPVGEGVSACLDIRSDRSGDLSTSALYSAPTPETPADSTGRKRTACGWSDTRGR